MTQSGHTQSRAISLGTDEFLPGCRGQRERLKSRSRPASFVVLVGRELPGAHCAGRIKGGIWTGARGARERRGSHRTRWREGTISKAVPQLLKLKRPFAVLPLGTANDFARTIGLPPDPLQAAEIALSGREHRIDVGLVNDRPYLNVASVGIASNVAKRQSKELKRKWRVFAYAIALVQAARSLRPFFVKLELDDKPAWSGFVYQASIGNGRFHGGGLTVAEHARIDDGKLDVYLVYPGRFWQLFASLLHLKFGLKKPEILKHLSATMVHLWTDRPRSIDADGGLATKTPATFRVCREALTVMVPRTLPSEPLGLSQTLQPMPGRLPAE